MNVVIIGQSWLAAETLKAVQAVPGVTVIAASPEKEDRFQQTAQTLGVPVTRTLQDLPPCDLILAAHCHRYVGREIREKARHGVLAYHPSLLPRHRGRDAIHWTLAMNDPIAGGTAYLMDDGADTGPIVTQDWCHVAPNDTPQTLWQRALAPMGVTLLTEAAKSLAKNGHLTARKQPSEYATWEPSLKRPPLKPAN